MSHFFVSLVLSLSVSLFCCPTRVFFFYLSGDHRVLHVFTHAFPTRRSSDLTGVAIWPRSISRPQALKIRPFTGSAKRSEEHTYELQSLMRISYAGFCLTNKIGNVRETKVKVDA